MVQILKHSELLQEYNSQIQWDLRKMYTGYKVYKLNNVN